jgi:ComF family protein
MNGIFEDIKSSISHLLFPHNCMGCATDILNKDHLICSRCFAELPQTGFANVSNNPIEKIFYGRLNISAATASFFYNKNSFVQHLLKQLKYKSNKEVGLFLGNILGQQLLASKRFDDVDFLIPLPLNRKKLHIRGYNQAEIICKGIEQHFNKPIINNVSIRTVFTESQTARNRIDRWQNMDGVFNVQNPQLLENKHILLVDDVITTGATIEGCGQELAKIEGIKISVASVAIAA